MTDEKEILNEEQEQQAEQQEAAEEQPEAEAAEQAAEEEEELTPEQKLEAELADQKDKYLRLMAEYDNFRKRSAKERLELTDSAKASAVEEILPMCDNFERALAVECSDENFKKGIEMIYKQFGDALAKLGVKPMELEGTEFDPNVATAVSTVDDDQLGENVVAQVLQNGYTLGDRVVRHAMVVVANP
ncbi:nucleotide exchange factor GrpE [Ruminococcus sp. NK3A76]|uniref:nucleotide exchange factor GrpE n=1 Tax=Ruminococcus sp. NK3A76 TaxID=877411 RepID=UPI000B2A100E|nr:nucleotide exchange factor GrpE [Ruminococcus sp. NK3A76]